jgi:MFS family permease
MLTSKWFRIAGTLMLGMFVAFLDRINLSVGLPAIAKDLGFAGGEFAVTSSWVLTIFLIGYTFSNFFGGIITRKVDPKVTVIAMMALWSVSTMVTGMATSVTLLLICRLILGVAEGVYWPQQSRFARAWFDPDELTKANSIIHFYGQYIGLALGFMILTPIFDLLGWRALFYITGAAGLVIMVPLYAGLLKKESESKLVKDQPQAPAAPLTFSALGGWPILLLIFTYLAQGMLFWGITLWIPMVVKSLGFTGLAQAFGSSVPYLLGIILAVPISIISDRTGKRVLIASMGLLIPGIMLLFLPNVESAMAKMVLITVAFGYYVSSFQPNIWAIIQSSVEPSAVGPAAGIINGVGAGGGGTLAGFIVGLLYQSTGSFVTGYAFLGLMVVLGGISLLLYNRFKRPVDAAKPLTLNA